MKNMTGHLIAALAFSLSSLSLLAAAPSAEELEVMLKGVGK